jgi:hypothetical protein
LVAKYQLGGAAQWVIGQEEPLAMVAIREVAKSIAPAQLESNVTASKTEVSYGNPVTLTGQITLKDKTPVASLAFAVEGTYPDGTVRTLTTGVTAVDGKYVLPLLIGKSVSLRVITEPSWERSASATQPISITVMRNLVIDPPTSVKAGSPMTISGFILPRSAGTSVTLTTASGKVIGAPVQTDAQGGFTFTIPAQARGIGAYQITVAADTQWPLLKSETFSIIIR